MEMAVFLGSFAMLFLMGMPIAASMFTSSLLYCLMTNVNLLFGQPGAEVPGWGFATLSSGKHPLGDACSLGNQTPDSSSLQITTLLRVQL